MNASLIRLIDRVPPLKRILKAMRDRWFPGAAVSSHYVAVPCEQAGATGLLLRGAWQDEDLPRRQRALVERQLRLFRNGAQVDVFDVLVKCLRGLPNIADGMSLLEIGCSSGYYAEVVQIAGLPIRYTGCDYSRSFIEMARTAYPFVDFAVEDATDLHYPDRGFDIVVSGGCLLHIPEYAKAIAETARVARCYAIFHRTPVVWGRPEQWYRKRAYGVETIEIHFNEPEFLALLRSAGLQLLATYTLQEEYLGADRAQGRADRTYVCKKIEQ